MEFLKLTSIRLSKSSLSTASIIASKVGYYKTSEVLRVAIWIGLKCITPGTMHRLLHLMWEEEEGGMFHSLEEVLRTAGGLKDECKG